MAKAKKNNTPKSDSIQISTNKSTGLSKDQKDFNRLSLQIDKLRKEIEKKESELDQKLEIYNAKILPVLEKNIQAQIVFVKFVHQVHITCKFSKKQSVMIENFIAKTFSDIIQDREIDDELKAIHDYYNDESYDDVIKNETANAMEGFMQNLKDIYDIEVDFSDLDMAKFDAETARIANERVQKAIFERHGKDMDASFFEGKADSDNSNKKKTKAEIQREELEKQKEELKTKNLRSLYLSLAKLFHPDLETDYDKKLEKEELMKKVTKAYDEKDLITLLKLEMEWVNNTNKNLENIADDKIKAFIQLLKEQVAELEHERRATINHPRFNPIIGYSRVTLKQMPTEIAYEASMLEEDIETMQDTMFDIKDFKYKKADFLEHIENVLMEGLPMDMDFDLEEFITDLMKNR